MEARHLGHGRNISASFSQTQHRSGILRTSFERDRGGMGGCGNGTGFLWAHGHLPAPAAMNGDSYKPVWLVLAPSLFFAARFFLRSPPRAFTHDFAGPVLSTQLLYSH